MRTRRTLFPAVLGLAIVGVLLISGMPHQIRTEAASSTTSGPFATDELTLAKDVRTRPVPVDQTLLITATLRPSDPAGLSTLLAGLGDPTSPQYRHYLDRSEFLERFGPGPVASRSVAGYFLAHGASGLRSTPDGFGLSFALSVGNAEGAFGTPFESFGAGPSGGYTAVGAVSLPPSIAPLLSGVSGLSRAPGPMPTVLHSRPLASGTVTAGAPAWVTDGAGLGEPWFLGSDYASAFRTAALFPPSSTIANASFPNRTAVATLLMSAYNSTTDTDLPPYDPVAVGSYFNDTFPTSWPHPNISGVPVNFSGITPPLPGYFSGMNDTTANSFENSLDLEMAGSMAPGASIVNFYFAGSLLASPRFSLSDAQVADAFATTFAAALSHNYSPAVLTTVSCSFGLPDLGDALWNTELAEAQAMGVTVVAASGDQGNAPNDVSGRFQGPWPVWPATAAFGTTGAIAVGGTTVTLTGQATQVVGTNGTLNATFDSSVTGVASATAWFDTLGGYGNVTGTEGGASTYQAEPFWQLDSAAQPAIVNATVAQGAPVLGRAVPDLAYPANTTVAYVARDSGGIYYEVLEGTSVAAPLLAGTLATLSAAAGHRFGYLDPEIYRIASFYGAHPGAPNDPFADVVSGANYFFSAAPGWDPTTGWGQLDAVDFLAADANQTISRYNYTGPTPGLPPPASIQPGTIGEWLLLVLGVSIAIVVIVVLFVAVRRPPAPGPYAYPPAGAGGPPPPPGGTPLAGTYGPPGYGPPATTFLCPYCGGVRPAEPVRCPYCGRL